MNKFILYAFFLSIFIVDNCVSMNTNNITPEQEMISEQEFHNALVFICKKPKELSPLKKVLYLFEILSDINVQSLLSNKIGIQFSEHHNYSLLHIASAYQSTRPLKHLLLQTKKITHKLINSQENDLKETPLHVALKEIEKNKCYKKHAKLLINAEADVNLKDLGGNLPLDLAYQNKAFDIADLLIKKGAHSRWGKVSLSKKTDQEKESENLLGSFLDFFETLSLDSMDHSPEIQRI